MFTVYSSPFTVFHGKLKIENRKPETMKGGAQ
jgi:hypothetical protein